MIKKLRRKFVAVIMGVAGVFLLTVFAVLLISTESGMRRQSEALLERSLSSSPHPGVQHNRTTNDKLLSQHNQKEPPEITMPGKMENRFPCFTALVQNDGEVILEDRAAILVSDFDSSQLEALAKDVAEQEKNSGSLSSYRLRFAKRKTDTGILVAFADTSIEYNSLAELTKNSLIIGTLTLLAFFGLSVLLARWAVRPVEQAWNRQKQFVGDASHELKTPLTVILSNADMLLAHPNEPNTRWAENIKAEAQRMKALTQQLLSLARSEDGTHKPIMQSVDLSYLVTDSVLSFEPAAFESGHELIYEVSPGLSVLGDSAELSQLCGILLDNAIKYSADDGKICVKLNSTGKSVKLSVSNYGDEIPQQELTKIFERFYRADPARHGEGHGLGLSIARQLTEQHRGKIWAESSSGVNTFNVLLPSLKV